MSRIQVLYRIDSLLIGCGDCETRKQMNRDMKNLYARMDGHCNKNCPVGADLQELGRQLCR